MNFTRHLLIDGANILHAWPDSRALLQRDRSAARSQLVQRVAAIHDSEQVRVTLVFDGRGPELVVERPSGQVTFSVLYTSSSLTADDVIEQLVGQATEPGNCLVATDDQAERQTVAATGAQIISSADLAAWISRAEARQTAAVTELRRTNAHNWQKP